MSRDPSDHPPAVADHWERLLEDARATAQEYREDGWTVLALHPGDVTALTDDPFGLDVLVPGDEFDRLQAAVERTTFEGTRVFRTAEGDVRFYVVAVEATADAEAVVIPAYLPLADEPPLRQRANDEGITYTHVRPLSGDVRVTFTHDDPEPFF